MSLFVGTESRLERRLNAATMQSLYNLSEAELNTIRTYGKIILPRLNEFVTAFYEWMETQPEYELFFSNPTKLLSVQKMQVDYWNEFFKAKITEDYLDHRRMVGETHARIGLSLPAYLAGMNMSLTIFIEKLYDGSLSDKEYAQADLAITRLMHLDTAVVVEAYYQRTNKIISDQHRSLMEMSTPVTAIWSEILMLPVVGIIDSKRAQDIMNAMLQKIAETQSRVIILDISGVGVVDTAVANHLIKITKATRLMGCQCTVSGVSPAIAQTIVELGIDVGNMKTTATLKDALQQAFRDTGVELRRITGMQ